MRTVCANDGTKPTDLMDTDAMELTSDRLRNADEQRVTVDVVEQALSRAIDEIEPVLTRNGYDAPGLASLLRAKRRCAVSSAHAAGRPLAQVHRAAARGGCCCDCRFLSLAGRSPRRRRASRRSDVFSDRFTSRRPTRSR